VEHASLRSLAEQQSGLFTWRQARASGYSSWQIASRLDDGRWRRVLGPVLSARSSETPSVRDRAALLAGGPPAVLSGPSAARLHGMGVTVASCCVTVPAERHLTVPGVRFLREPVGERDLMLVDDLFVTRPDRTVFDCLRVLPRAEASRLLDRALQKRWITLEGLTRRVAARRAYPGSVGLQRFVDDVSPGARSAAERVAHEVLRANGITGWVANFTVQDGDALIAVVDLAFPQLKLAIELDGGRGARPQSVSSGTGPGRTASSTPAGPCSASPGTT
jgi:hypothetical protein